MNRASGELGVAQNEPKTELASSTKSNPKLLPTSQLASPLDFQANAPVLILKTDS
ncbi:MAG: hypothetical protein ACFB0B_16180 [Thermonemataceae bacterium]